MKRTYSISMSLGTVVAAGFLWWPFPEAHAQLWLEFAHPGNPHVEFPNPDIPISVPELLGGPGDIVTTRPVLVVLLEFQDVTHRAVHTTQYWEDLVFADPRPGVRPSVAQTYREISNGRLSIAPATAGDVYDGSPDGVIGWVASSRATTDPWWNENGEQKGRAEGIIVADPLFDYHVYDNNNDGIITSDELTVLVVFAENLPTNCACDQHIGHTQDPCNPCIGVPGGRARLTHPNQVPVDQNTAWPKNVHQLVTGVKEVTRVGVVTHEIGHSTFGLGDLYGISLCGCNPALLAQVGDICHECAKGSEVCHQCAGQARNDACVDALCLDDARVTGEINDWVALGSTVNCSGTDLTDCAPNDSADVWFTYTPAVSEDVTISFCVPNCTQNTTVMDSTLSVFDACGGNQLSGACSDDFDCDGDGFITAPCDRAAQLTLPMTAGTKYWIRVSGALGATGNYRLRVWGGGGRCTHMADHNWWPVTPAVYSLMDDNPEGYLVHLDPWAKIHLGFVKPVIVTHDGLYTLFGAETDRTFTEQNSEPEVIIVYDSLRHDPYQEYFVLENRDVTRPDGTGRIDRGLAVWLINENPVPGETTPNPRRMIRLLRRNGQRSSGPSNSQALWDGIDDVQGYDLTATSSPANTSWTDGSPSYVDIYDISVAGPVMTFRVHMPPIFVDSTSTGIEDGSQAHPFNTVSEGVTAIPEPPRTIRIAGGSYPETLVINTPCTLMGWRNGSAVIGQ